MLDALCTLLREQDPLPNVPQKSRPPASLSELYYKDTAQLAQINDLTREAARHDLDVGWNEANEMVTAQRVKRVQAFREVYVNAFDLPFAPEDYQRLIRNKALQAMAENGSKADVILKAVEVLGKTTQVQAFADAKTLNITMNQPEDQLRAALRDKIAGLIASIS
jgi:hypothetical protein